MNTLTKVLNRPAKIITMGHTTLRKIAAPVTDEFIKSKEGRKLIDQMIYTLRSSDDGVGLAAPQIDKSIQMLVVNVPETEGLDLKPIPQTIIFNPKIEIKSADKIRLWEGCLSVPGLRGIVNRNNIINVTYKDENAQVKKIQLTGLLSAVFQHEADHLIGKIFLDRITPEDREKYLCFLEHSDELEQRAQDVCTEGYWKYID